MCTVWQITNYRHRMPTAYMYVCEPSSGVQPGKCNYICLRCALRHHCKHINFSQCKCIVYACHIHCTYTQTHTNVHSQCNVHVHVPDGLIWEGDLGLLHTRDNRSTEFVLARRGHLRSLGVFFFWGKPKRVRYVNIHKVVLCCHCILYICKSRCDLASENASCSGISWQQVCLHMCSHIQNNRSNVVSCRSGDAYMYIYNNIVIETDWRCVG